MQGWKLVLNVKSLAILIGIGKQYFRFFKNILVVFKCGFRCYGAQGVGRLCWNSSLNFALCIGKKFYNWVGLGGGKTNKPELQSLILPCEGAFYWAFVSMQKASLSVCGYTTYKNVFISSSSRLRYLWSMSHSICSFIIFFCGMNMFLRISTSSVWRAAFVILFLIFMILTIASWKTEPNRLQGSFSLKRLTVCLCRERDSRSTLTFGATTPG